MSRDTYPLKLPHSIEEAAQRLPKEYGVSLTCTADRRGTSGLRRRWRRKIGVVETAAEFFKKRAGKAKGDGLVKFLRNARMFLWKRKMKFVKNVQR